MKTCSKCKTSQDESRFSKRATSSDGLDSWCKNCYYNNLKIHRQKCKQETGRVNRNFEHTNTLARESYARSGHKKHLRLTYRLTPEQYLVLQTSQGNKCAICFAEVPGMGHKNWSVDHDRSCCLGEKSCGLCVRGLLCGRCNSALGLFSDSLEVLESACRYLRKFIK